MTNPAQQWWSDTDDTEEQQWQNNVIRTMERIHDRRPTATHDELLSLLEEPTRELGYTLDFYYYTTTITHFGTSPLETAVKCNCIRCLRTLFHLGASADYTRYRYRSVRAFCKDIKFGILSCLAASQLSHHFFDLRWRFALIQDMMNELLLHGADVNVGFETSSVGLTTVLASAVYCCRRSVESCMVGLVNQLLDSGACITEEAWRSAAGKFCTPVLRVLMKHADERNQRIPLHMLFERLQSEPDQEHFLVYNRTDPFPAEILQNILRHGYIPDKNNEHVRNMFVRALKQNSPEADKVVLFMLHHSPTMLQACRGLLQDITLPPHLMELLAGPPSLQQLCRAFINSTIGYCNDMQSMDNLREGYMEQAEQLPLPRVIIKELAVSSIESQIDKDCDDVYMDILSSTSSLYID